MGDLAPLYDRVAALEKCLKTHVPGDIRREFWPLPLLEKLLERIEALEKKIG